jgi:cytochrome c-type biogenesis protein CcmH
VFRLLLLAIALTPAMEAQDASRRIEERFMAPCCWRENLAVHQSPQAQDMRAEIRDLVASGKTEEQIVEFYVAQYGERILREPRGRLSFWAIVVPVIFLLAGASLVMLYVARARRPVAEVLPEAPLTALPDLDDKWI